MPESLGRRRLPVLEATALSIVTVLFVILMGQVVLRYLGVTFVWVEEVSIALFIWLVFLGAAMAFRRGDHPIVELGYQALRQKLSRPGTATVDLLLAACTLAFLVVLGIGLAAMTRQTWNLASGLVPGFRVGFVYLGVLGCCLASLWAVLRRTRAILRESSAQGTSGSSII